MKNLFNLEHDVTIDDVYEVFGCGGPGEACSNVKGLSINKVKVQEGNVQIQFGVTDSSEPPFTITFDSTKPMSVDRLYTCMPGSGGGAFSMHVNDMAMAGNDYMTMTYSELTGNHQKTDASLPQILKTITGNQQSNFDRAVVSGASAGGKEVVALVEKLMGNTNKPIDIMLLDAAGPTENETGCQSFKEYLIGDTTNGKSGNSNVVDYLKNSGSVIYAYESAKRNGGPDAAAKQLQLVVKEGIPAIICTNSAMPEHAEYGSVEKQVDMGEVSNVMDSFESSTLKELSYSSSYGKDKSNVYYIVDPESSDGYLHDVEGNRIKLDARGLSNYLYRYEDSIGQHGQLQLISSYDENGEIKNQASTKDGLKFLSTGGNAIEISLVYNSVAELTNEIVKSVNDTKFFDKQFDYQFCNSTTAFPDSLNSANTFLYSASDKFLKAVANDVENIATILNNYSYLDNHLAAQADYLSGNNDWFNSFSPEEYGFSVYVDDIKSKYTGIFEERYVSGQSGRITIGDIDNILNGNTLMGPLGNGLNDEFEDALDLKLQINNLINNADFVDPAWNMMIQNRLIPYSKLCDMRANAARTLEEAYVASLNRVKEYYNETLALVSGSTTIDMGGALDDGQIPVCEAQIVELKQDIVNLKAEYAECEAVPELRGTGEFWTDEKGVKHERMEPNEPQYTNARMRMKEILNVDIPFKEQEIDYNNTYITQLQGLAGVLNEANGIVLSAIDGIEANYVSGINAMGDVFVQPLSSSGIINA